MFYPTSENLIALYKTFGGGSEIWGTHEFTLVKIVSSEVAHKIALRCYNIMTYTYRPNREIEEKK